jgi:integrase
VVGDETTESGSELVLVEPEARWTPALRASVVEAARGYAAASRAASTRLKYARAWDDFAAWCAAEGQEALPAHPAVVAGFLAAEAARGLSPSAVQVKLSAIGWVHRRAGRQNPLRADEGMLVAEIMAGIRRSHGRTPRRKAAADADVCRDLLHHVRGDGLREVRDRALIAFGIASCMRRSELVALQLSDLVRVLEGLRVTIRRSKGDQEGRGAEIAVPEGRRLRPVALLEAWIAAAGITDGPLFRRLTNDGRRVTPEPMSDRAVARVLKERCAAAGLDPATFAGHSLRAGFLTAAARAQATIFQMQQQSRHRSVQVLSGYVRSAQLFEDHAGKDFL